MALRYGCLRTLGMAIVLSLPLGGVGADEQLVVGAGPSTKVVALFFELFSEISVSEGYIFTVPARSAKHAGGIDASGKYLFGRTGRPLNAAEKARKKEEILLARIPIAFATGSEAGVTRISLEQLRGLFTGRISNWRELGGGGSPVALVGREKKEVLYTILRNAYPFFEDVRFNRIFTRDHQVVNYLKARAGRNALAFGSLPNLEALNVLEVSDFEAGVSVGLVYDRSNREHAMVKAAKGFSRSEEWREAIIEAGYLPAR